MTAAPPPDLNTKMTERARRVWSQGDFARAAALRGANVTATDFVPTPLAAELASCLDRFNRATDGTLIAPADYLQVVAVRAAG